MEFWEVIEKSWSDIWVIGDTHFGHRNILELEPTRGKLFGTVKECDDYQISEWNKIVGPEDVVLHLGDFSLSNQEYTKGVVDQLNFGKLLLLGGNHDRTRGDRYWLNAGISMLQRAPLQVRNVIFSHQPLTGTAGLFSMKMVNIHAHMHSKGELVKGCVSVECTGFKPVKLVDVIAMMNKV